MKMELFDKRGIYGQRHLYRSEDGRFIVEITVCESHHGPGSLMDLWVKNGWVDRFMDRYLTANTEAYLDNGDCKAWYNPQRRLSDDGRRLENAYEWILEATPENEAALLAECVRRYENDERI